MKPTGSLVSQSDERVTEFKNQLLPANRLWQQGSSAWSEIGEYYVDQLKQIGSEVMATLLYPIDHVTVEMPTIDWEEVWTEFIFNIAQVDFSDVQPHCSMSQADLFMVEAFRGHHLSSSESTLASMQVENYCSNDWS